MNTATIDINQDAVLHRIVEILQPPCMTREAQDGFRYHTAEDAYRIELCHLILAAREMAQAAIKEVHALS